ncbi:3-isopropylmalate dehydratase large subunit [Streptomyces griseocarneus]|uniref:3-isopropylmalate dehydratase large subunit n=1 Tax=Streptomyces griseocarneus TaxID=51201 RepID=UPI00167D0E62|nr:3-isopropylmalate dehydratase large subunit [Streptomyces griseocarneus]MBZ6473134.1 3-isopropylmalate dehydratase large subunit [Streptomyces griseocarneus]GHG60042.1 3-isopropylmalate dehydratase large subunit [Streptomyces griseocarneus]
MGSTLAQKTWDAHVVRHNSAGDDLLYIDLQLLHEVNTPQAFDRLRAAGRTVRRPDLTVGTEDHNTPTIAIDRIIKDPSGRRQAELMRSNCAQFGIPLHRLGDPGQGIVHVIAPELGLTRPGMTIVCCDSHTTTLGAFGALAFGIGASQVEHVLATQTLSMRRMKDLAVNVTGELPAGVTAKDVILALIAKIGTAGGQGHIIEYRGDTITALSMEARMTLCNMSVEAGSRAGLIAPDETTFAYLESRPGMPQGPDWDAEVAYWKTLRTDADAVFDKEVHLDAATLSPYVSWGTNPGQSIPLDGHVPAHTDFEGEEERTAAERALEYMDLKPGTAMRDIAIDTVFLGSCTNSRIEDLRAAADVLKGRRVADGLHMVIVPGSAQVRRQAVEEGLDRVFAEAGADFRAGAGCSMCAALNEDRLRPGERAASTNNRNFEGRQGRGSRTHIVSPPVAAATAVAGRLAAPADL